MADATAPDVDGLEVHDSSSKVLFWIAHEGYTVLIEELGRLRLAIGASNTSPLFHEVHLAEVFRSSLQWESRLRVKDIQLAVVTENALYGITLGCLEKTILALMALGRERSTMLALVGHETRLTPWVKRAKLALEGVYRSEDWNDGYFLIPAPTQDWEAPTPKNEKEYEKDSDIVVDPRLYNHPNNEPQENATEGGSQSQTAPGGSSARTKALCILGQLRNCNDLSWHFSRMLGEAARAYNDSVVQDSNQAETPPPSQHLFESTLEDTSIPIDLGSCDSPYCNLQTGATVIASHEKTALQSAAEDGNLEEVKVLLKAAPHACTCTESSALDLGWALRKAAGNGHLEIVTVLLEAGADVSAPAPQLDGLQTLYEAVKHGHPEVVDALLKAGANVDNLGYLGETALREAVDQGNLEVVNILVRGGADVNVPLGQCGKTALQAAASRGNLEIVNALLEAGADVNAAAPSQNGRTALQAAVYQENLEVANVLLKAGADVIAPPSESHKTPLQALLNGSNLEMLELLLPYINGEPGLVVLNDAMELGSPPVQERLLVRLLEISQEIERNAGQKRSFWMPWG